MNSLIFLYTDKLWATYLPFFTFNKQNTGVILDIWQSDLSHQYVSSALIVSRT